MVVRAARSVTRLYMGANLVVSLDTSKLFAKNLWHRAYFFISFSKRVNPNRAESYAPTVPLPLPETVALMFWKVCVIKDDNRNNRRLTL
jgi:hypothetical protein